MSRQHPSSTHPQAIGLHLPSGPLVVAPGPDGNSGEFPAEAHGCTITVITAHDPHGRPHLASENRAYHARLVARLAAESLTWWPATAFIDDQVPAREAVAIADLGRGLALDLGRAFGQESIIEWAPSQWCEVSTADGAVQASGWAIEPTPTRFAQIDEAYRALGLPSPYQQPLIIHGVADRLGADASAEQVARLATHAEHLVAEGARIREAVDGPIRSRRELVARAAAERAQRAELEVAQRRAALRGRLWRAERLRDAEPQAPSWPAGWQPAIEESLSIGETRERAVEFAEAGWPVEVVLAAARVESPEPLDLPEASPAAHLAVGDNLLDALLGLVPGLPAETRLVVARTYRDGRAVRWHLAATGSGVELVEATRLEDGTWRTQVLGNWPGVLAAMADVPELRAVPADATTEIVALDHDWIELIPLLDPPPAGIGDPYAWPPAVTERWLAEDEALAAVLVTPIESLVRLRVNGGRPIAFGEAEPESGSDPDQRRWLTIDLDGQAWTDPFDPRVEEIGSCRWADGTGSGRLMPDAIHKLVVLEPGVAGDLEWQGDRFELRLLEWPDEPADRASIIARWIRSIDAETAAAFTLVTPPVYLKPVPADHVWERWADVPVEVDLAVDEATARLVNDRLDRVGSVYAAAKMALHSPATRLGRQLRRAVSTGLESGSTTWVHGSWIDLMVYDQHSAQWPPRSWVTSDPASVIG